MNLINTISILLVSTLSFYSISQEANQIENINTALCVNTYQFEILGNLDEKTIANVKQFIMTRNGICHIDINSNTHLITIQTTKDIDEKSLAGLIRFTKNKFVTEECSHNHENLER